MAIIDIERADHSIIKCDTEKHIVSYFRYFIKFTPIEWKILKALYERSPKFMTRDELIELVWNVPAKKKKYKRFKKSSKKYPTRTVDVHIAKIRKKLECIRGARIDSVYGMGYRFLMLSRF